MGRHYDFLSSLVSVVKETQKSIPTKMSQLEKDVEFEGVDVTGASVGQIIKVAKTDEKGKPTAWEPVDLPKQAQADWNRNDSTAADYIKNRPFYAGDLVETELFDVCALVEASGSSWVDNSNGIFSTGYEVNGCELVFDTPLIVGNKYSIQHNGSTYECTAVDGNDIFGTPGSIVIGDIDVLLSENITYGVVIIVGPYVMIDASDTSGRYCIFTAADLNGSAPTELKVIGTKQEIVKIDPKFISETDPTVPDWAKQDTKPTYTLNEIQGAKQKDFIINFGLPDIESDGIELTSDLSKTTESVDIINNAYRNGSTFYANYKDTLIPMTYVEYSMVGNRKIVDSIKFSYTEVQEDKAAIVSRSLLFTNNYRKMSAILAIRRFGVDFSLSSSSSNPVMNSTVTAKLKELKSQIDDIPGDGLEKDSTGAVNVTWIINSSTEGSSKKFKLSVDDSGTISATEIGQ